MTLVISFIIRLEQTEAFFDSWRTDLTVAQMSSYLVGLKGACLLNFNNIPLLLFILHQEPTSKLDYSYCSPEEKSLIYIIHKPHSQCC